MLLFGSSRNLLSSSLLCSADMCGVGGGGESKKRGSVQIRGCFSTWILYQSSTYGASERKDTRLLQNLSANSEATSEADDDERNVMKVEQKQ